MQLVVWHFSMSPDILRTDSTIKVNSVVFLIMQKEASDGLRIHPSVIFHVLLGLISFCLCMGDQ